MCPRGNGNKRKNKTFWDSIQNEKLLHRKETTNKTERQCTEWEKIFASDLSDKELVSKYMKNLYNSTPKRQIIQLKMGRRHEHTLLQRKHPDDQQTHEKMLISLIIGKCQSKLQ